MSEFGVTKTWSELVADFWCCVPPPETAAASVLVLAWILGAPYALVDEVRNAFFAASGSPTEARWEQFKLAWTIEEFEIEIDDITIHAMVTAYGWSETLGNSIIAGDTPFECSSPCLQLNFPNQP